MQTAPIPTDEAARLARLRLLNILDTQPEERFDRLTRMAQRLFGASIATVTLIDSDRQWFKSRIGIADNETPRDISFCGHAILSDEIMLVSDASRDERFFDNPLVTGAPNIRFYAGAPLTVDGNNLGTLCIIDEKPRTITDDERIMLRDLADMVEQELTSVQLATTDHLTSLSNRRGFETLSRHTLAICRRRNRPATLLFFDLKRFKQINDTRGHAAGDRSLQFFARALVTIFRETDIIGRLSGDEFVVLLTDTPAAAAADILPRLHTWLETHAASDNDGIEVNFNAGLIEFDSTRHQSVDDLLREADALMYQNKRSTL